MDDVRVEQKVGARFQLHDLAGQNAFIEAQTWFVFIVGLFRRDVLYFRDKVIGPIHAVYQQVTTGILLPLQKARHINGACFMKQPGQLFLRCKKCLYINFGI